MMKLKKIKPIHILILAIFEFVTLFIISLIGVNTSAVQPVKNFSGGIIVGFVSTIIIVFIANLILEKTHINVQNKRIRNISLISPAVYNAMFLAVLFFIESFSVPLKEWNVILGNSIAGAITTPLSIAITLFIYNNIPIKIGYNKTKIHKIGIIGIVIIAAIYESIALPIMAILPDYLFILNSHLSFAIVGFIAGIAGGIVAMIIYNIFLKESIYIKEIIDSST